MKALIHLGNGKILVFTEAGEFGGPWGQMLAKGEAVLTQVPANEDYAHLAWDPASQTVVVNQPKKDADTAKATARAERKARIKGHSTVGVNSIAALRAIVEDLLADKQDEIGG